MTKKAINKIFRFVLLFIMVLGILFSNGPFYIINSAMNSYLVSRDIVDKAFNISRDENVVDKFNSYRNLAEGIKIQEARAAASFIGNSNTIYTNGGAPGAITPNAFTMNGDLLVFYHYSRATGGNETVSMPAGFTPVFNSVTANYGLVAVGWRIRQAGDGAFQAAITNHTSGTSGETVIEFIQTYRGTDTANPIVNYSASLSTWSSSLNIGPIAAPATAIVNDGDMAVVFGGRFENVTGQTVLTGNSLTWAVRTTASTTQGADAGAVVQTGLNSTGASQTVTAKTVTTTGTTQAGAGRMFIIKKQVNTAPILSISQPDGVGDTVNAGDLYNITYSLSDAEDIVTAAFYYDTDATGLNGTAITGACASATEGGGVTCSWDTTGMTPGNYYVYGITNDGVNPEVSAYSPGMIAINNASPDATSVTYQVGGDGARSGYSATITGTNFGIVADGNQTNCAGGAGTGCIRFIVGGSATVADADIISWSNTSVVFTVNSNLSSYGGLASLQIVSAGNADGTPLDFYIYPNITSLSANSGQIGSTITVFGDHFGATAGTVTINTKTATVGTWGETSLTNVKIPGQEGAINVNGKIQLARSDAKASNQYPADPSNFIILAPSMISSNPAVAATGQTLTIEFSGSGIDTETGIAPILKLTKTGQTDITGVSYLKVADYQTVSASFDLTGAATGYWKLVIINMDGQSGSFGDEISMGFNISPLAPTVTGINPGFGSDSGVANIASITGTNFQADAEAKLTKTAEADITPSTVFSYTDPSTLSSGAFSLSGKTNGWWNVVVNNVVQGTSGTYGNEINTGFQIRSSKPSLPSNIYQFKTNTDSAQPPTANIAVGNGIGGQVAVYFRMDMEGGITGENYFPQVEAKPVGAAFECGNASPTPCVVTSGYFAEGGGVLFNGTAEQGWVSINGVDGESYHWQVRVRNSGSTSNWVSFGGNNDPNDIDFYIDNTPPAISLGTDNTCATAAPLGSITDLSALIQWNTSDNMSGAASVFPGSGAYAKVQVDYKKGIESWSTTTLSSWENSIHQVALSGLSPATVYIFRARSQDYLGNESISVECSLTTTSSRPIKTVEFFIGQETDSYKNILPDGISKKYFTITLPESPASAISVKSAFIEITGVASPAVSQAVNVGLLRGDQTLALGPVGENYALNSDSTTTPFVILFNALSPSGTGQESMADITTGATPYDYTLFLKGDGVTDIWLFSAKLVITYSYEL